MDVRVLQLKARAPDGAAFPGFTAYLTFLRLSILICKMGMIVVPIPHRLVGRIKRANRGKCLEQCLAERKAL